MVKREESEAELRGIAEEGVGGQARRECRGRREEEEEEDGRGRLWGDGAQGLQQ